MKFLINPNRFNNFSNIILKPLIYLSIISLILGLVFSLYLSPNDYQQGLTVRIMYIHVPSAWLALLTFFIIIPLAVLLLNIETSNFHIIFLSFLIGSTIITCIASISGSMNLLNNKNFAIGSLIIMILSIPVIIFSVSLINVSDELIKAQLNILLGFMFFFLAITPWICAACIKLALQSK